jgi:hypothetical protein
MALRRLRQPKTGQLRMLPATQMPRPQSETSIKKDILALLDQLPYVLVTRTHAGKLRTATGHWVYLGKTGWPDISGTVGPSGRSFYLETKTEIGALTSEQKEVHAALRALGAYVGVARSTRDAISCLAEARK